MISRLEQGSLVTVFGGSGFVGRHAVRALAAEGWRVRAAVRRPDLAGHLQPMGAVGQIHAVQANVRFPDSVRRAVEGADAVVNLVGILAKSGPQTFQAVHVAGARAIAEAARAGGAKRLAARVGPRRRHAGEGHLCAHQGGGRGGRAAELPGCRHPAPLAGVRAGGPALQPLRGAGGFSPFLPLIGGGKTRLQPVYAGDVGAAIAAGCAGRARPHTIYELGGPEVVTFRQLLDRTMAWSGRRRRYLRIPFWLAKLGALLTVPLPNGLRPLTVDQVRMLQRPTTW